MMTGRQSNCSIPSSIQSAVRSQNFRNMVHWLGCKLSLTFSICLLLSSPLVYSDSSQDIDSDTISDNLDVDDDGDGLIEIHSLSMLDNVRNNLTGTAYNDGSGEDSTGCGNGTTILSCFGYELIQDLDFDTNSDGLITAGDAYWNNGDGWEPVGDSYANAFSGVFEGNGHQILNFFTSNGALIGYTSVDASVRNLGFHAVAEAVNDTVGGGSLIRSNRGEVSFISYKGTASVTGLIGGTNSGEIHYVSVIADIVGNISGAGVASSHDGHVSNLFSAVTVSSTQDEESAVFGEGTDEDATIDSQTVYWDKDLENDAIFFSWDGTGYPQGRTTVQLKCPTFAGDTCEGAISYGAWDSNYWDFGTSDQYPALIINGIVHRDSDGDLILDVNDPDDDNDGVLDEQDYYPFDPSESADTDGDGVGDNADAFPNDPLETADTDRDGIGDNTDADIDGDGVLNGDDAFPYDRSETLDMDGDGVGNNSDPDIDGDGVSNALDSFPLDASETTDMDGDGVGDNSDSDIDGDGVANGQDAFPYDPSETNDSDGDGVGDNVDAFVNDASESVDSDSDGTGNNADTDDDNDGINDSVDPYQYDVSSIVAVTSNSTFRENNSYYASTGQTQSVLPSSSFPADQFVIAPANDSYISYNRVTDFVINSPLQIFNLPGDEKIPADVIVILADDVHLASAIEIIGPPTDLIILERAGSGVDGDITCSYCSFENVNRVTIGAISQSEASDFDTDMDEIGYFSSVVGSATTISYLDAPGALSLELISEKVSLSGEIDLNRKVVVNSSGSYEEDPNGDSTIGTGSVNLYLGRYTWHYELREILGASEILGTVTVGGTISAPNVYIFSTYNLNMSTKIDTRTDLLATSMYRGSLVIVDENIVIETANQASSITIQDNIWSEGSLDLRSAKNLTIAAYTDLSIAEAKISVSGNWINYGELDASYLYAAAGAIQNEGYISAYDLIELYSEDYIFNQYGGAIRGENITLSADSGIIRNGSKTPYKSSVTASNNLISYASDYTQSLSATMLGAFYQSGVDVNTSSQSYVMAPDSSASIVGNRVLVDSTAFENINPYYEFSDADSFVEIDLDKALQISISGEDALSITTSNYILNSSAQMYVNSPSGMLTLDSALVNNERYRVQTGIAYSESAPEVETFSYYGYQFQSETINSAMTLDVAVYSVPGLLSSMGDARVRASQSFLNNTSYVEVFGNLYVDSPAVSSLGYLTTVIERSNFAYIYNGQRSSSSSGASELVTVKSELDTLFFVDGQVSAAQTIGWFSEHEPVNHFLADYTDLWIEESTDLVLEQRCFTGWLEDEDESPGDDGPSEYEVWIEDRGECTASTPDDERYYENDSYTHEVQEEGDRLRIVWTDEDFGLDCYGTAGETNSLGGFAYERCAGFAAPNSSPGGTLGIQSRTRVAYIAIYDALKNYYDELEDWFASVYDEVRFW